MEATIDTLNIKVEGDGNSAESALDRVLKKLERIKEATRGTNGGGSSSLNSHFNNLDKTLGSIKEKFSAVSQITDDLREKTSKCQRTSVAYADAMDSVKEKAEQSQGRFKTLSENIKDAFNTSRPSAFVSVLKMIGRLTLYRMIRSMIKQVTEGFKTGIDDMYQYSKTFNGEYARSMDQLASANLSYKNSIGAIMAPLINLVTPWIDSFVDKLIEINNTIAMVFAGLAGKSTYSKAVRVTTEYAEAANKASENTSKVTDKVEELKRSLAGLDEITIIGNNNTSPLSSSTGGSDGVTNGVDYSSMFVETPVDMAKVNEIKEKFEDILEIAKWIGIAIAAWEFGKFILGIGQAIAEIGRLKAGIALMITGFTLEGIGAYHIGYGDADIWDYIKFALGSVLGVAGSLLVFGANSMGWTIGITAALVIAIANISIGLHDRIADVIEQAFYDAGGTITISDLAGQFERLMTDIININQPIIDAGVTIDNTMEQQVRPAIETIREIGKGIELNAYTAEEKIPELVEQFEILQTGTKTILDEVYNNVIRAISGSLSTALIDAGEDVPSIVALLAEIKGETDTTFESITKNFQDAKLAYDNGSLSAEDYADKILSLTEQMNSLVGATDPVKDSFAGVEGALAGIDWESKDAKDLAFSKVNDSATAATQAVNDAHDEIQENLETMRSWSDNADYQLALDKLMIANDATQNQQLEKVKTYTAGFYDQIQSDMLAKMVDMTDTIAAEYDNLNWFQKIFAGSKDDYVATHLKTYKETIINPVMDGLETLYRNLGIEGAGYASEAADAIIDGLYMQVPTGNIWRDSYARTSTSRVDAVRDAFEKVGKAVPDGMIEGIKAKGGNVVEQLGLMAKESLDKTRDVYDTHSPSKETESIMRDNLLGFINGIKNNRAVVMSSLDSFLNGMLERMETFGNRWRSSINDMFDDMAYAWRSADFRSDGSYSYNRLSMRQIQRFAQGGFPEDGFFYANHNELVGQFSNGKTAVANNEQIIEGIAGGVASANEEQNTLLREQNRLLREQNRLIQEGRSIDVSTIASAFNRKNQRDGKVTVPVSI